MPSTILLHAVQTYELQIFCNSQKQVAGDFQALWCVICTSVHHFPELMMLDYKTAARRNRCKAECRTYKWGNGNICLFKSNYCKSQSHGTWSCCCFCPPLPPWAVLCVYKWGIMAAGCISAAGYFVFGGEDMTNQTTSHMKDSSRSIYFSVPLLPWIFLSF